LIDFSRNPKRHPDFKNTKQEDIPPIRVEMEYNKLVPGFVKALHQMRKGSEANVIIPASLGY